MNHNAAKLIFFFGEDIIFAASAIGGFAQISFKLVTIANMEMKSPVEMLTVRPVNSATITLAGSRANLEAALINSAELDLSLAANSKLEFNGAASE